MNIFIPNKEIQGRAVNSPGHPAHGRILLKNPSGVVDPGVIIPGQWWTPYLGNSILDPAPSGFTQVTLANGARMIYLSDEGSDSNDGLAPSRPKRTQLEATGLIRQGMGDILCIRRGENTLWDFNTDYRIRNNLRGGAAGKPTVITWYGTGTRPRVIPPQPMDRTYHSFMWFIGIHWVNPYAEFGNPLFNGGVTRRNLMFQAGGMTDGLVEDCRFTGCELTIQQHTGPYMANFTVRRNIWDYVYVGNSSTSQNERPSCIYSSHIDNLLIEENVHDFCGWHPDVVAGTYNGTTVTGSGSNQFNHCYYIQNGSPYPGPHIKNNLISRPSSHGWQLRSGGIAEFNLVCYASVGGAMGYWDSQDPSKGIIPAGRLLRMNDNVIMRANGMYRMLGSCQNSVCSTARWGLDYTTKDIAFDESQAIWESFNNIVSETSTDLTSWPTAPSQNTLREVWRHNGVYLSSAPHDWVQRDNNKFYHYSSSTEGDGLYVDPGRSIEGYISSLAGEAITYDEAMDVLKNRGPYEWRSDLSPLAIRNHIAAGYTLV